MPILVALIALIALVYGAVRAFFGLQAAFGSTVAVSVAILAALVVIGAVAYWWRRRQEVAANIHDGDWTHEIKGSWGSMRMAAAKRLCEINLGAEQGAYIFADLRGADVQERGGGCELAVKVRDAHHTVWNLPMESERQAKQWKLIVLLAMAQKL